MELVLLCQEVGYKASNVIRHGYYDGRVGFVSDSQQAGGQRRYVRGRRRGARVVSHDLLY